jgi:solute carrier family 25 (mitochondrial phosphate transporter), member 23/24/25/41
MQVVGLGQGALGYQYNGALEAAQVILKTEGMRGMYRGLWPNLRE